MQRLVELGDEGGALLAISGNPEPELFADLDGGRIARFPACGAVSEAGLRADERSL